MVYLNRMGVPSLDQGGVWVSLEGAAYGTPSLTRKGPPLKSLCPLLIPLSSLAARWSSDFPAFRRQLVVSPLSGLVLFALGPRQVAALGVLPLAQRNALGG